MIANINHRTTHDDVNNYQDAAIAYDDNVYNADYGYYNDYYNNSDAQEQQYRQVHSM